jgi:U3 small nucleolar RNA-associated protein 7
MTDKNFKQPTPKKILNLDLPEHGPYSVDHTRNGRFMILGGERGHIASNWGFCLC